MAKQSYRELDVWSKAMALVERVYQVTSGLPETEKFGLRVQIQRAAVSVPANIAEGYGRAHRGDYLHHLSIARGSLCEMETLIALAVRLKMLERRDVLEIWSLAQDVGKMLLGLTRSLQRGSESLISDTRRPIPDTPA